MRIDCSLKSDHVRAGLLAPILEIVLSDLRSSFQGIEHGIVIVHHEANMVDASRVVLAITLATKED